MAESKGFEPLKHVNVYMISNHAPSANSDNSPDIVLLNYNMIINICQIFTKLTILKIFQIAVEFLVKIPVNSNKKVVCQN